jgi:hypothetical protein
VTSTGIAATTMSPEHIGGLRAEAAQRAAAVHLDEVEERTVTDMENKAITT